MTTLLDVVQAYMGEAELSDAQLIRFMDIAQRGLMDLHMKVSGLPVTVKLEGFNSDLLINPLPGDFISLRRLGYLKDGVIVPFFENPRIKLYNPDAACHAPNQNAQLQFSNNMSLLNANYPYYWTPISTIAPNGALGGFSNLGGSAAYYCDFRIDENNGYIQYGSNPGCDVYMEYLANPKKIGKRYRVHPFDGAALIAWIAWRDIANKKNVSESSVTAKRKEYWRERGEARKMHYNYNITNAIQMIRQTNKATPQF